MTTEEEAECYKNIRALMGYVQNGSDTVVTLFQDDTTHTYHVKVGKDNSYWGDSMKQAIDKAIKDNPPEF